MKRVAALTWIVVKFVLLILCLLLRLLLPSC
jgi:hypothetical protein